MKERICSSKLIRAISGLKTVRRLLTIPLMKKLLTYEMISYVICGGITTVVNYISYFIFSWGLHLNTALSTTLAFILAVASAFVLNKVFVFLSPDWSFKTLKKEFIPFILCRLLSYGFDMVFSIFTIDMLGMNEPLAKILSNIFVLIANYFASKYLIFKKPTE